MEVATVYSETQAIAELRSRSADAGTEAYDVQDLFVPVRTAAVVESLVCAEIMQDLDRQSIDSRDSVTLVVRCKTWVLDAFKRLVELAQLQDNWDSYGAEAPEEAAIGRMRRIINRIQRYNLVPSSIDASAEGGVCVSFRHGEKYADIECFNNGEVLAVTSLNEGDAEVWEIADLDLDLERALEKLCEFFWG